MGEAGRHGFAGLRADIAFVSPAFHTASHPGAPALGPLRWAALASRTGRPAAALGGLDARNAGELPREGPGRAVALAAIAALKGC